MLYTLHVVYIYNTDSIYKYIKARLGIFFPHSKKYSSVNIVLFLLLWCTGSVASLFKA